MPGIFLFVDDILTAFLASPIITACVSQVHRLKMIPHTRHPFQRLAGTFEKLDAIVFVKRAFQEFQGTPSTRKSGLVRRPHVSVEKIFATKCGTSLSGFTKNNSYNKNLCSTLIEGQVVCCPAGLLPDIRPKPKANGECATHFVDKGQTCSSIAALNGLKTSDLDEFNKQTWYIQARRKRGMKIVNNGKPPDSFKKIVYYESWNQDRPCMHMDVRTITSAFTSGWTHVHFAFANITSDYKASVKDSYGQFKNFKGLKGIKRIIAFGGWSFSVGVDTYTILREAVNREAFANEVVRFVKDHDVDGVDFGWEYPGVERGDQARANCQSLNFGGTSDWAINLQEEWADTHNVDGDIDDGENELELIEPCDKGGHKDYKKVSKGYDDKFKCTEYQGSGPCTEVELRVPIGTPKAANRRFITYKMRDEEGFYEALLANHGIEKSWVEWKDYADHDICICPNGPHARDVDEKEPNRFAAGPICPGEAHAGFTMHKNYPQRIQDTSKIDVPNPKAIIEEAIPKTDDLTELLYET
ncbi:killer toxin subunits alpha beta [Fusarium phyllophilum]|uniref:chitinase n=1 Tax=Fusarium phyllophilum TaxID=47803 RepID=A0A8H5NFP1_9HYPO|nr:killer toxin subunits alpha beta [Fusarium phyllophilum]